MKEPIQVTRCELPDRAVFDRYVDQIFDSGWLTNRGALVRKLENKLEAHLGVKNLVLVSNGTMALQIATKLLNLSGEVITTPFTFIATSSALKWEGLQPVFADINPHSFNLDPSQIEQHITSETCAILPVHVFGNPCETEAIEAIAKKHGLKVIYDAAHCFGVKQHNRSILNLGDISILSLHATKLFHTGEGGALIIKDDKLCAQAREMINFGITGPESIVSLGINAKMTELQAAMGLALLPEMDQRILKRKKLATLYDNKLPADLFRPVFPLVVKKNFSYYPVLFNSEAQLRSIQTALNLENIHPRRYFYPALNTLKFLPSELTPYASSVASRVLCLPLYSSLTEKEIYSISQLITSHLQDTHADTTNNNDA